MGPGAGVSATVLASLAPGGFGGREGLRRLKSAKLKTCAILIRLRYSAPMAVVLAIVFTVVKIVDVPCRAGHWNLQQQTL